MKKSISYIYLAVIVLFATGCQDYLIEEPLSSLHKGELFSSTQNANIAVQGVYRDVSVPWGDQYPYVGNQQNDICMHDEQWHTAYFTTWRGEYSSASDDPYWIWIQSYKVIADANAVIANVPNITPKSEVDEAYKRELVAEAKFLRAFTFFDLVRFYGPVPLYLYDANEFTEEFFKGRTPVAEILDTITKDLLWAYDYLPDFINRVGGRTNRWAAATLLAKVYMTRGGHFLDARTGQPDPDFANGDPAKARPWLEKAADILLDIEQNSGHALAPVRHKDAFLDYGKIFLNSSRYDGEVDREIIYDIQYLGPDRLSYWGGYAINGGRKMFDGYFYPWSQVYVGLDFNLSFHDDDVRYKWDIAPYATYTGFRWQRGMWSWTKAKHRHESTDQSQNANVYRYADVLLMLAEVVNELAGGPSGIYSSATNGLTSRTPYDYINEVRARAYVPLLDNAYLDARSPAELAGRPFVQDTEMEWLYDSSLISHVVVSYDTMPNDTVPNILYTPRHRWYNHGGAKTGQYQDLFRDALQMERAWELCFERFRFFDLKRWGIHYERVKKFRRQNGDAIHKDINDPIVRYNNLIGNIWGGQESYANLLPHHSYLPIPQISMSVNPNLKDQNLGY